LDPSDKILVSTLEVLDIPANRSAELAAYSLTGIRGPLHFAGFFDPGFKADGVFEVRSDELSKIVLEHGMPMSWMRFYRMKVPEKLYGKELGSHYQGQIGPKVAKYFRAFDFDFAAKNYEKLHRDVLVQDERVLMGHRPVREGFVPMTRQQFDRLYQDIKDGFFLSRYDCESDELVLQLLPYVVVFGPDSTVFTYIRSKKIKEYGETRLFGEHSIGLGGHIVRSDGPEYIAGNVGREVFEEEIRVEGRYSKPRFVGTLMAHDKPVDTVHLGLILVAATDGRVVAKERAIRQGRMVSIDRLVQDPECAKKYETWSRVLIPYLPMLQRMAPRV
jgi:predicted NUDIX family phosphoesterase